MPHLRVQEGAQLSPTLKFFFRVAEKLNMLINKAVVRGIDPKQTEGFLLTQADVLDASVWLSSGQLQAHVTVSDRFEHDQRALQLACMDELGLHQTPASILLIQAHPRAA